MLSSTETIKSPKVCVPILIIRNNRMVKGLSIPIVRNKELRKVYRYLFSETIYLANGISIPIGQTHRSRLSAPISYRPQSTVLKMSLDSYWFHQYVQINWYNRLLAKQQITGYTHRYTLAGPNRLRKVPIATYREQRYVSYWNRILSIAY